MRLDQSSVDISTLYEKIERAEIDIQRDFQRGQVWSESKKKRLVDTILRGWYVPAIHLVVNDDLDVEEVLDGQQRLRAIVGFINDEFQIDGRIEPSDSTIAKLHGLKYSGLPDNVRSRFRRFTINTVRLRDYRPEEPGELFFRLNQLTALTAAEQRNALIGKPRNQIRRLASQLESHLQGHSIGFSNARMNYDDTLSRLAIAIEGDGLSDKVTAARLERRYRRGNGFAREILDPIAAAINLLSEVIISGSGKVRLNRASLFSWLFFITNNGLTERRASQRLVFEFFRAFETVRTAQPSRNGTDEDEDETEALNTLAGNSAVRASVIIFNDRSSSRVNDVSSVLLRDLCLNVAFYIFLGREEVRRFSPINDRVEIIRSVVRALTHLPDDVAERALVESSLAKRWETGRESR